MNDTHPEIEKKLNELYSKLSPQERFEKMLSMCQTVREIILSQMQSELPEKEKRKLLFIKYYEQDFSKEQFEMIVKNLFEK